MNPDLMAAAVAYLRSIPEVVKIFGDAPPEAPKFWSDYAGVSGSEDKLPYLVLTELASQESYETITDDDIAGEVADGIMQFDTFAEGKTEARQLSTLVADTLRDAPLEFDGGGLIYFRPVARSYPVVTAVGPQGAATAFKRTIQFRFLVEHDFPLVGDP